MTAVYYMVIFYVDFIRIVFNTPTNDSNSVMKKRKQFMFARLSYAILNISINLRASQRAAHIERKDGLIRNAP